MSVGVVHRLGVVRCIVRVGSRSREGVMHSTLMVVDRLNITLVIVVVIKRAVCRVIR